MVHFVFDLDHDLRPLLVHPECLVFGDVGEAASDGRHKVFEVGEALQGPASDLKRLVGIHEDVAELLSGENVAPFHCSGEAAQMGRSMQEGSTMFVACMDNIYPLWV